MIIPMIDRAFSVEPTILKMQTSIMGSALVMTDYIIIKGVLGE